MKNLFIRYLQKNQKKYRKKLPYLESFFLRISVKSFGFHCHFEAFIDWPTKNQKSDSFPQIYSPTCSGCAASTSSAIFSSAPVSLLCFSPSFSTHSRADHHSKTSFSIISFELVDESSSLLTILITFAISSGGDTMSLRLILRGFDSNIAKSTVVI